MPVPLCNIDNIIDIDIYKWLDAAIGSYSIDNATSDSGDNDK